YYMIIYLAGLQTIPQELYEAATVDGAHKVRVFFSITLPLLRPITVAVLILATIAAFQSFDMIFIMTQGGPAGSTTTLLWNIYNVSFAAVQPGQGAAMGVVLFTIILVFSLIQFIYFRNESL
ncbi:MAG TPA: sugar ABC transporter permease, partial [Spirochaetia bacterium]|nr:sugar ABC transporter permease [Spirochaetia bacterium]